MLKSVVLAFVFLTLAACGGTTNTPSTNYRTELAKTELAATAAYRQVTALVNAGVIRKGSQTAVIIADAELALAAAIRVWRTNPENPKFAEAGIAALPSLLQLIASAKAKTAGVRASPAMPWALEASRFDSRTYRRDFHIRAGHAPLTGWCLA